MPLDRQALVRLRKKNLAGLTAVAVELTNQAKVRATRHVDSGTLRNSVTHDVKTDHVLWGIPLKSAPHAKYLEYGFRPHFVPAQHIALWARRRGVAKSKRFTGLFVGGRNSSLEHGPGIRTRGRRSDLLPPNKVGFSVLRWTVKHRLRPIALPAFARGWRRA